MQTALIHFKDCNLPILNNYTKLKQNQNTFIWYISISFSKARNEVELLN